MERNKVKKMVIPMLSSKGWVCTSGISNLNWVKMVTFVSGDRHRCKISFLKNEIRVSQKMTDQTGFAYWALLFKIPYRDYTGLPEWLVA